MKCPHEFSNDCVQCLRDELAKAHKTIALVADMATALSALARDGHYVVHMKVAEPASADDMALVDVAANTSTPANVLTALARDRDVYVRWNVALNTSTPTDVLAALAHDEHPDIRCGVARNTSTPADVLVALARDGDWHVRFYVASNTSTPTDALTVLVADENAGVRAIAREQVKR